MSDIEFEADQSIRRGQITSVEDLHPGIIIEEVTLDPNSVAEPVIRRIGVLAMNYNFLRLDEQRTHFAADKRTFVGMVELGDDEETIEAEVFYLEDVALGLPQEQSSAALRFLRFAQNEATTESSDPPMPVPA